MICQFCNEEINDTALFCPVCGQKSEKSPQVPAQTPPQVPQTPPQAPAQESGMKFGQRQRLTPPGQAPQVPQTPPQAPQTPPQAPAQTLPAQESGMKFGQRQRLTPPGQAPQVPQTPPQVPQTPPQVLQTPPQVLQTPPQVPQTPPQVPQTPPQVPQTPPQTPAQTPPAQESGMKFGQRQRLTPPGQAPQVPQTPPQVPQNTTLAPQAEMTQSPPPVAQLSQKQRLTPPPQVEVHSESTKKWPIFLGLGVVLCAVIGVVGMKMNATVPALTQGTLPEITTSIPIDALATVKEYTHFANRSEITNEAVMAYFSQGTWEEVAGNNVYYEGLLYGSQESIKVGYTVDSATGQGTLIEFSVNNVSLGRDYETTDAFFTQLFQLACSGFDSGQEKIPSFDLNELLYALVRYTEITEGSYLYYCDLDDVLYPDNTWAVTPVTDSSFYVDFKGFEQDTMVLFSRLLVETTDATVNMVYFTEDKVEYDLEGLKKWTEEASDRFLNLIENGGQITTAPQVAPEVVSISDPAILDAYIEELQRYNEGFLNNWSANQFKEVDLPETSSLYTVNSLYVTFVDFDNNGIPEMVVTGDEGLVLSIHTLIKNSTGYECKTLISDNLDNKISLGNGGFIAETMVTTFDSSTTLYQVSGGELKNIDTNEVTWIEDVYEAMPIMALLPAQTETSEEEIEPETESEAESEAVPEVEIAPETVVVPEVEASPEAETVPETESEPDSETPAEIETNTT